MSPLESLFWLLLIFFAPSIVAFVRRSTWRWYGLFVNVVFGPIIVGWFLAWFFAFHAKEETVETYHVHRFP